MEKIINWLLGAEEAGVRVGGLLGRGGLERTLNDLVWGVPAMVLILGTGVLLSILCRFPQFTRLGYIFKNTLGRALRRSGGKARAGSVSPFKAMCTALAASIGTGNIAGVSGAIAIGGPGAVFWMWVSALVGMCTKYAEVTLAVRYRERNAGGDWVGGPMYYIKNGLGGGWRWLAVVFALFGGLASFGIGNLTQVNTIAGTVNHAVAGFIPTTDRQKALIALVVGIVCAAVVLVVLIGGIRRIGDVCALLVPVMALIYVAASLVVILANAAAIPAAFTAIFVGAFTPQAVAGGVGGATLRMVITKGVGRGIFSNEAGLGSAPIAHAASDVDDPVAQGIYGVFEVFMDTIVVCTMTALVVLLGVGVDSIPYGTEQGAELTIRGFQSFFGGPIPAVVVAVCLTLFALSTVLTWGLYGSRCFEFLFGSRAVKVYQFFFVCFAVAGAVMRLDLAWNIADTLNGLMAIPNLVGLLLLSPAAAKMTREHFARADRLEKRLISGQMKR